MYQMNATSEWETVVREQKFHNDQRLTVDTGHPTGPLDARHPNRPQIQLMHIIPDACGRLRVRTPARCKSGRMAAAPMVVN